MATAAATMDKNKVSTSNIHDDIAFSILSKLPIKSLTRFTCAQKLWSLLLQNPYFMNMFRNNFISKLDDHDDDTRLVVKETNAFFQMKGERFEDRVRLDWPSLPSFRIFGSVSVNGTLSLQRLWLLHNHCVVEPCYQVI